MTPTDYEYLPKLLKDRAGLDLSGDKQYLIESRLLPLSRKAGLAGISAFKPFPERRGLYRPNATQAAPARISAVGIAAPKVAAMAGR